MFDCIGPKIADSVEIKLNKAGLPCTGRHQLDDFLLFSDFRFWNKRRRDNRRFTFPNQIFKKMNKSPNEIRGVGRSIIMKK